MVLIRATPADETRQARFLFMVSHPSVVPLSAKKNPLPGKGFAPPSIPVTASLLINVGFAATGEVFCNAGPARD